MSRSQFTTGIAVVLALLVIAFFFFFTNPFIQPGTLTSGVASVSQTASTTGSQLIAQDEVVGNGADAKIGDMVIVDYVGKLPDGTVFDTTAGKNPFSFTLGASPQQVISGWEQGIQGMKVGGKRLLIVPPQLAYGSQAVRDPATGKVVIPANSTLIFEITLDSVIPPGHTAPNPEGDNAN